MKPNCWTILTSSIRDSFYPIGPHEKGVTLMEQETGVRGQEPVQPETRNPKPETLVVGAMKIPFRWTMIDGREISRGLTLTQFAALNDGDGLAELVRMARWLKRSAKFKHLAEPLCAALDQEHLREAVAAAKTRWDKRGARVGKARAAARAYDEELAGRALEYGLQFSE